MRQKVYAELLLVIVAISFFFASIFIGFVKYKRYSFQVSKHFSVDLSEEEVRLKQKKTTSSNFSL